MEDLIGFQGVLLTPVQWTQAIIVASLNLMRYKKRLKIQIRISKKKTLPKVHLDKEKLTNSMRIKTKKSPQCSTLSRSIALSASQNSHLELSTAEPVTAVWPPMTITAPGLETVWLRKIGETSSVSLLSSSLKRAGLLLTSYSVFIARGVAMIGSTRICSL